MKTVCGTCFGFKLVWKLDGPEPTEIECPSCLKGSEEKKARRLAEAFARLYKRLESTEQFEVRGTGY